MSITVAPEFFPRQALPTGTTSYAECTWLGHCLGDACQNYDGCDNDWICVSSVCSPCCETAINESSSPTIATTTTSSSTTTVSATAAPSQAESKGGLSTAASVGIGVGVVALLILCAGVGFWMWFRRKHRTPRTELPANPAADRYEASSYATDNERKRLYEAPGSTAELPGHSRRTELQGVELVELEGSTAKDKAGAELAQGDEATRRTPRYQFEEHTMSPGEQPGEWVFSPVTDGAPTPTSRMQSDHPSAPYRDGHGDDQRTPYDTESSGYGSTTMYNQGRSLPAQRLNRGSREEDASPVSGIGRGEINTAPT